MITELAILQVKVGLESKFEHDFSIASQYISASEGYISHSLSKCLEHSNQYLLLVYWQSLEHHTQGFRGSASYVEWKKLLHHYYEPFPTVEHYHTIFEN
jgi:heme-degrading monooxygenase HmoA